MMGLLSPLLQTLGRKFNADAQQTLLRMGEVSRTVYFIEKGCARLYVIDASGKETTTQFFFEEDAVGSLESLLTGQPSMQYLATIEPCTLIAVDISALLEQAAEDRALQAQLQALLIARLIHYVNLYASSIAHSPTQRYTALQEIYPERMHRIPLKMLAAYIGISPVHMSRIRSQLKGQGITIG